MEIETIRKLCWGLIIVGCIVVVAYMIIRTDPFYVFQLLVLPVIFFAATMLTMMGVYHIHKRFKKNGLK